MVAIYECAASNHIHIIYSGLWNTYVVRKKTLRVYLKRKKIIVIMQSWKGVMLIVSRALINPKDFLTGLIRFLYG